MESNYYQEYEYISFFAPESESNHPLGEMVTSPQVSILCILLLMGQPIHMHTISEVIYKIIQVAGTLFMAMFVYIVYRVIYYI